MKTWLRLTLVICLVGGGFTLLTLSTYGLFQLGLNHRTELLLNWWFAAAISIFTVVSGLVVVYDCSRTRLAQLALALQIPYFSSPWFGWRMACGAGLTAVVSNKPIEGFTPFAGVVWINVEIGAKWAFSYFDQQPLGIGINIVALFLFIALRHSTRAASQTGPA